MGELANLGCMHLKGGVATRMPLLNLYFLVLFSKGGLLGLFTSGVSSASGFFNAVQKEWLGVGVVW
ncbi:hypothetical protein L1S32_00870 [Methanogenium sp. S4BF]|uniref:hypothetical protein n=1 Tax=Methanogenium sp. S4BF TaxID=1789226 RepID=UPI0024180121|nr:hypothetical protein [Methanogenium sp. S4BF]WFN34706.1 hypothetical protein L1S32_00870 [Methanogenium sp. S4BF]